MEQQLMENIMEREGMWREKSKVALGKYPFKKPGTPVLISVPLLLYELSLHNTQTTDTH